MCKCVSEDMCTRMTYSGSLGLASRNWIYTENRVMKRSALETKYFQRWNGLSLNILFSYTTTFYFPFGKENILVFLICVN